MITGTLNPDIWKWPTYFHSAKSKSFQLLYMIRNTWSGLIVLKQIWDMDGGCVFSLEKGKLFIYAESTLLASWHRPFDTQLHILKQVLCTPTSYTLLLTLLYLWWLCILKQLLLCFIHYSAFLSIILCFETSLYVFFSLCTFWNMHSPIISWHRPFW